MKLLNFVNRIEEDKNLRLLLPFLVQLLKNGANDVLMHLLPSLHQFIVVFHSLQGHPLPQLLLHHLVNIELNHVLHVLLIKV